MLSACVPIYNKGPTLVPALEEIEKALRATGLPHEMVLVDDASTDSTPAELARFCRGRAHVRMVRHEQNKGKGHSLLTAFEQSRGELVLFIDADLDLPPDQMGLFLYYLKRYQADAVIGSKRHPDSIVQYPLLRRLLSRGYQIINFLLFGLPISDTQVGLKLFKREVLQSILGRILVKRYAFDLEILLLAYREGYHIKEAPIVLEYSGSPSAVNYKNIFYMFIDTLAIFYRLKILHYYDRRRAPEPGSVPTPRSAKT